MGEPDEVAAAQPSAYPFILVDRLLAAAPGERAVGLRNITANDPLVAGGGGRPFTLRRSLLVDSFAQLAALAAAPGGRPLAPVEIAKIDSMSFVRSPVPGDQLVLTVELSGAKGDEGGPCRARCRAEAGGELVAEGEIEFGPAPAE